MKKLFALMAVLVLLAGCKPALPLSDSEQFIIDFELSSEELADRSLNVSYLSEFDELKREMSNGTHIVLLASGDQSVRDIIFQLAVSSLNYPAVRIYFYKFNALSAQQIEELKEEMTPFDSEFSPSNPTIYFIKNAEIIGWHNQLTLNLSSSSYDALFSQYFQELTTSKQPGCDDC